MPVPTYRRKNAGKSSFAVVTLSDSVTKRRRDVMLGEWGSDISRQRYVRAIADWEARGRRLIGEVDPRGVTVAQLADSYRAEHGETVSASQQSIIAMAVKMLIAPYGDEFAEEFGPNKLRAMRVAMLQEDGDRAAWGLNTVRKIVGIVKHIFRWGVAHEMVSPATRDALAALEPLRGYVPRVSCVSLADVAATIAKLREPVASMVRFQLLTGARPGEVCSLRACEIEITDGAWSYVPREHKGTAAGRDRRIYIGPQAQAVLQPLLHRGNEYVFAPTMAYESALDARKAAARGRRKHPYIRRGGVVGDRYDVASYRRAIRRACLAAGVTPWHPHQLRHNAATLVRQHYGIEAARIVLGHATIDVTEIYADRDAAKAREIAEKLG